MWHVLHAAPHGEAQICRFLGVHNVEACSPEFPPPPRTRAGSVRDRRLRTVFPGYVFFRIPISFTNWDLIRWAPGVRRVLQEDGSAACLSDEIVDHLRSRLADRALRPARRSFRPGEPVVIQSGPLRMVDAIFEKELDAPSRVQILVQLLGRPLAVEVDPTILRAAG
jgi:transcription antitermination factor NusG